MTAPSCNMTVNADGIIMLQGALLLTTVESVLRQSDKIFANQSGNLTIDLAAITHTDSSALALLMHWSRARHAAGRSLACIHVPKYLLSLAQAFNVEEILPLIPTR